MKKLVVLVTLWSTVSLSKMVDYSINITSLNIQRLGQTFQVLALAKAGENPTSPGPILEFIEGDWARITFHNLLSEATSIHWHGLLVPNDQDGVPDMTTPPIKPGETFTYSFPIRQSGTYWYHSHSGFQEQQGVYGAIVIHPAQEELVYDREQIVLLNDWSPRNPKAIQHNLKTDQDWEQISKGTLRSWFKDIKEKTLPQRVKSEWDGMGPMDDADVFYPVNGGFLINGQETSSTSTQNGETIRLRIINASSSTYFTVAYGNEPLTLVAADGQRIESVSVNQLTLGMGETYDAIVRVPEHKQIELRATSVDVTGKTSLYFGTGPLERAPDLPKPKPYMSHAHHMGSKNMSHDGHMNHDMQENHHDHTQMSMDEDTKTLPEMHNMSMDHSGHHMDMDMSSEHSLGTLNYSMLKALNPTILPPRPTKEIELDLTGDMWRYVWSFNNKTLAKSDVIPIERGTNIRIKLVNKTMMHHPLHLHGHYFRVLNGQGDWSPLKHTVDIPRMGTVTIEFYANDEKDWVFHCHNLYHMASGMVRIFHYEPSGEVDHAMSHSHISMKDMSGNQWFQSAEGGVSSSRVEGHVKVSNDHYDINSKAEFEYPHQGYKSEYKLRSEITRNLTSRFGIYGGAQNDNSGTSGALGIEYKLPLLIDSQLGASTRGIDFSLSKDFYLGHKTYLDTKVERKYGQYEYNTYIEYRKTRNWSFKAGWSEHNVEGGTNFRK